MAKTKKKSSKLDTFTNKAKKFLTPPVLFVIAFALIATAALVYSYAAPGGKKKPGGDTSTSQLVNISLTPASARVTNGSEITLDVRVNTQNQPINAAQASLIYDASKLEFVRIDSSGSVLDMKLIETGGSGKVEIVQGTAQKYAGQGLLAKVVFKALSNKGKTKVEFTNDSALAHAETNTNILQQMVAAELTLSR